MSKYFIGLSTTGHDPAIAIVNPKGQVIFAESTERFLQDKRAWGAMPDQVNHIRPVLKGILAEDPHATFQMATSWLAAKADTINDPHDVFIAKDVINWMASLQKQQQEYAGKNLQFVLGTRVCESIWQFDHHLCHAVNAVYSAPFENAACVILDGEGEVGAASLYSWNDGQLRRKWRSWGPGSLGAFYSWLTDLSGFSSVNGEEWKVMGLAAYGAPVEEWVNRLLCLLEITDGRIHWANREVMANIINFFESEVSFKGKPYMAAANLAASAQTAYSRYTLKILQDVHTQTGHDNLILGGGCALNSSFNGTITNSTPFKCVHVPSAPADDGNAIGAALLAWQKSMSEAGQKAIISHNQGLPYLGSAPEKCDTDKIYNHAGAYHARYLKDDGAEELAQLLAQGKIVGVMRGAAEFGPRALGHRSILADPRSPNIKDKINALVKGREAYRPFAPVIPIERVTDWFVNPQPSPYMSFTLKWKYPQSEQVPAVVHEDGTGRLQTLTAETAPWLKRVTELFGEITGVPVLLNTSFNIMGKPIVHSVNDAVSVFMSSGLDAVLIDTLLLTKK
ncbi:carbamoyltransferase C-terminal domain-containing protein [uncultured Alteromonas sp.]|jgi:carbamoyltransferase|uniref:carbamoyltransferase family protein n=1 Tax=uncultured Alteromonas sp. TaxID=179113 RepID=UPI0025D3711D|nr:carbamoyltransferase C-terminal domain-containing protein [uncultured Alteromonas sp.]